VLQLNFNQFQVMMKRNILILLTVILYCEANRRPSFSDDPIITLKEKSSFSEWMQNFPKVYKTTGMQDEALINFVVNKRKIDAHNKLFDLGLVTFKRALWEHSDLSSSQKARSILGGKAPRFQADPLAPKLVFKTGPVSVDWIKTGLVGPVLEQGVCGNN
jgi:Cathepsin propeptide inhibitor domain (I29)